jgi:hypothetical protein
MQNFDKIARQFRADGRQVCQIGSPDIFSIADIRPPIGKAAQFFENCFDKGALIS